MGNLTRPRGRRNGECSELAMCVDGRKASDGGQMPNNRCSNCIAYNFECTYVEAAKKRGPPKGYVAFPAAHLAGTHRGNRYVESLENRLEKMEKLLSKLCPDADFSQELGGQLDRDSWLKMSAEKGRSAGKVNGQSSGQASPCAPLRGVPNPSGSNQIDQDELDPSDDEYMNTSLLEQLKKLSINPNSHRFFGKSSGVMLIQTAIDMKNEYSGEEVIPLDNMKSADPQFAAKRPEFWNLFPWEKNIFLDGDPGFDFPAEGLVESLVDLYFKYTNVYYPLFHRPTFEKNVAEGLHLTNDGFASVLLAVCAVGARWSNDPRVLMEGTNNIHSAGWKWFSQAQIIRKSLLSPPCLFDVQLYCLSVFFLQGSSAPQGCWTMAGIGLRLAQDVGAHRRKVYSQTLTVEDEMWKRAFWILVSLDRFYSSALGRPCAIQDEDFDLDFPVEVDDEYWETGDPKTAFKQPEGKPSKIAFFNSYLKLNQILAFALRTIYSINKSRVLLGFVGQQWEQHIVAELDSALNKWIDSVPDHLRWDPTRETLVFFKQSANLYCHYYHLQILVHRPFIPLPRKPSPLSFPSLAICTNAARSCSHVVDVLRKRSDPMEGYPHLLMPVFSAAIVLLLNIWGGKRSGLSTDPAKEMTEVHKCMQLLKMSEHRFHSAGRLWDVLCELATVGELPLPQSSPAPYKRDRESDSPRSAHSSSTSAGDMPSSAPSPSDGTRVIAGSRRVSRDQGAPSATSTQRTTANSSTSSSIFTLPIHSAELGRLPLHPGFEMPIQNQPPLNSQDNMWYGGTSMASGPSGQNSSAASLHSNGIDSLSSMFQMDPLMYEQMLSGYPGSYLQSSNAPPQQYQQHPPMYSDGIGTAQQSQPFVNNDTITMWSNAPTGFELDDWGTYITSVSNLSQQAHHPHSSKPDR
ncbi:hypothetical protein JAAARDRAFT_702130 [Jaapia argillacea MUCL 33604]|uniref:Xylanolytic transcriptional activator regulatory domain-containing protein n=1 Tax=Jaapia argillacea MUCL 33604 TaxID=933084 RepID=A0A067PN48_9AGAM|nr:hypothetical protein JAAARDRAFT_702130 [Jaapia argillacea MUCL 33604]